MLGSMGEVHIIRDMEVRTNGPWTLIVEQAQQGDVIVVRSSAMQQAVERLLVKLQRWGVIVAVEPEQSEEQKSGR